MKLDKETREYVRGLFKEFNDIIPTNAVISIKQTRLNLDQFLKDHNLLDELEVGWYKCSANDNWLSWSDGKRYIYGIDGGGYWKNFEVYEGKKGTNDYLATTEEVSTALIAEAKKQVLIKGARINHDSIFSGLSKNRQAPNGEYTFDAKANILFIDGMGIFNKGSWATIVEEKRPKYTPEELERFKFIFEQSRLTNPIVGFKHDTIEELLNKYE